MPAVIYASASLIREMDQKIYEQAVNVATLPFIVKASYARPDAHWGYGFPIGGAAAFDPAGFFRLQSQYFVLVDRNPNVQADPVHRCLARLVTARARIDAIGTT